MFVKRHRTARSKELRMSPGTTGGMRKTRKERLTAGPVGDIPFQELFEIESLPRPVLPDGPIITAVARDEMLRLPDYLRHHRNIGIRHFLIVDNGSVDGTGEYLDAQPDVTRFYSTLHFKAFEPIFRPWLADNFGVGRWVLSPDIDEHFIYPGCPDTPLDTLLNHWQGSGYEAVFAPMVDMYSDRPLSTISHDSNVRLAEIYSHFDCEGYWLVPPKPKTMKESPTPPAILYGGARDRYNRTAAPDLRDLLARALVWGFMNHRNPKHPLPGARFLNRKFMQRRYRRGPRSKVPLVFWHRGIKFNGCNHRIKAKMKLAPDWGALLHFRLMIDHMDKEAEWDSVLDRTSTDRLKQHRRLPESNFMWKGSRRFSGWRDLEAAGLIRVSDALLPQLR